MEFKARQELEDSIPHVEQSCSYGLVHNQAHVYIMLFPLFSKIK